MEPTPAVYRPGMEPMSAVYRSGVILLVATAIGYRCAACKAVPADESLGLAQLLMLYGRREGKHIDYVWMCSWNQTKKGWMKVTDFNSFQAGEQPFFRHINFSRLQCTIRSKVGVIETNFYEVSPCAPLLLPFCDQQHFYGEVMLLLSYLLTKAINKRQNITFCSLSLTTCISYSSQGFVLAVFSEEKRLAIQTARSLPAAKRGGIHIP